MLGQQNNTTNTVQNWTVLKYKGFIYFLLAKKVQIAKLHLSTCLLAQSISENVCYDLGAALTFEHSFQVRKRRIERLEKEVRKNIQLNKKGDKT